MGQNRKSQVNSVRPGKFDPFLGRWVDCSDRADAFAYQDDEPFEKQHDLSPRQARGIIEGRRPLRGRRIA